MSKYPMTDWGRDGLTVSEPNVIAQEPQRLTFDLTNVSEVEVRFPGCTTRTTGEHFADCLAWLLACVDTNTVIEKDGVSEL